MMEQRPAEYPAYPNNFGEGQPDSTPHDAHTPAGAAAVAPAAGTPTTYQQTPQDVRPANYPPPATPTTSDYGVYPQPARDTFDAIPRYNNNVLAQQHNAGLGGPSPYAYPPNPYGSPDLHNYNNNVYARPDWQGYGQPGTPLTPTTPFSPVGVNPHHGANNNTTYAFVPITGSQQHKRPRRRYEEIERIYKCGWNGCEKAYGTLNHLNAHVTMQSHGQKRTPEEFKEIRKKWKERKKQEEADKKKEEEEARRKAAAAAAAAAQSPADPPSATTESQTPAVYHPRDPIQLPPIGYQHPYSPNSGNQQALGYGHMYNNYPPHTTYGQAGATPALYNQQAAAGGQHAGH